MYRPDPFARKSFNFNRFFGITIALVILGWIIGLGILGLIVWAAIHFAHKYW